MYVAWTQCLNELQKQSLPHCPPVTSRTEYCLPSQDMWLNLWPNMKEEGQLQGAEYLLHTSALLAWEQAPRDLQHGALHGYSTTAPECRNNFEQTRTAAEKTAAETRCCCLGNLSITAFSHACHSGVYRSQAVGQVKSPGSTDEQSHMDQEKRTLGKTQIRRPQLASQLSPHSVTQGEVVSLPYMKASYILLIYYHNEVRHKS